MKAVKITLEISHSTIVEMAHAFKEFLESKKTLPPEMINMQMLLMKLEKAAGKTIRLNQGESGIFAGYLAAWIKEHPGTPNTSF